jgi:hypothetical protein
MRLSDLRDCFEGVIPSVIATLDADGLPNASYLSQVFLVDDARLAVSNQFFSKTAANVRQTGRAALLMVDGRSGRQYVADLAFERSVEAGELFERMDAHLKALSMGHGAGMAEVMRLRGADIYRVEGLRPTPSFAEMPASAPAPPDRRLAAVARVADALAAQSDPDPALDVALERLDAELGFPHAMILALDEAEASLALLASRGYPAGGVGSEVPLGAGAIGIAAQTGRPVRIADLSRGQRLAGAALSQAELDDLRVIPLPGLPDPLSQLAAPMIAGGKVRGVVFVEAATRFAFAPEDEQALALVAALLAAQLAAQSAAGADRRPEPPQITAARGDRPFRVRYYPFDDSVFVDEAYLIKGVPGRLLHHFLRRWLDEGRGDFSNRELRLDAGLRLPDLKDNLETRLILLKRRLDEKAAPIRLTRPGRGLIRLEVAGTPTIEVIEP